jgi:hypothetical protein
VILDEKNNDEKNKIDDTGKVFSEIVIEIAAAASRNVQVL